MKPSIILTCFFCAGIISESYAPIPIGVLWGLILMAWAGAMCFKFKQTMWMVLFLLLGAMHTAVFKLPLYNDVSKIDLYRFDNRIKVRGIVVSDPDKKHIKNYSKNVFYLEVEELYLNNSWQTKEGKILVNLFLDSKPEYGDILLLEGKLHYPYNFSKDTYFSYSEHLSHRGIKFILSVGKFGKVECLGKNEGAVFLRKIYKFRSSLAEIFKKYLSPKEAALMIALVLGQQDYIPNTLRQLFVETGTAHILAVSGFNVGVVAFVAFFILKLFFLPRKVQYVFSILVVIFYAVVTGGQAPVVRSAIMAVIFLLSFLIDHEADVLNSLALAAMILLIVNPLNLFDVGFQLSFLSVFFIVRMYPVILKIIQATFQIEHNFLIDHLAQSLAVSLAAFIGVSGLIVYYFGIVTPISIVANLVIVPLSSINIVLGLCLLMIHNVSPIFAQAFAMCIHLCLNVTVVFAYLLSQLPLAFFYIEKMPKVWIYGYYFMLFIWLNRSKISLKISTFKPKAAVR